MTQASWSARMVKHLSGNRSNTNTLWAGSDPFSFKFDLNIWMLKRNVNMFTEITTKLNWNRMWWILKQNCFDRKAQACAKLNTGSRQSEPPRSPQWLWPSYSSSAGFPSSRDSHTVWQGCCARWRRSRTSWCEVAPQGGCLLSNQRWRAGKTIRQYNHILLVKNV